MGGYAIDQDSIDQNGDSGDSQVFDVDDSTASNQYGNDGDQPDNGSDNQDGQLDDQGTWGDDQGDQGADVDIYDAYAGANDGASDSLDSINGAEPDGQFHPTRIPWSDAQREASTAQKVLQPFADAVAGTVNLTSSLEGHALGGVYSLLGNEESAQEWHGIASRAMDDAAAAGRNVLRDIGSDAVDGERESMWNP